MAKKKLDKLLPTLKELEGQEKLSPRKQEDSDFKQLDKYCKQKIKEETKK